LRLPVFATDTALAPQFISQAGEAGRRWLVLSNSAPADSAHKFAAPLASGGNHDQFASQFAANAYSIANLILDGIASGTGRDRAALLKFVLSAKRADGEGGQLFKDSGDPNDWVASGYKWAASGFTLDRDFRSSP
jgi:hypothetical protein